LQKAGDEKKIQALCKQVSTASGHPYLSHYGMMIMGIPNVGKSTLE